MSDDQSFLPAQPESAPAGSRAARAKTRKSYTTRNIANALERRYPSDKGAYGILYEVGNATGFECNRHCDALVMSLWPSRGVTLSGFEFKASRSDWQKELADPAKSESIQRYCDFWWLAVTDESIVREGELPVTWGLMALDARGSLKVVRDAPKLSSVPMDRSMLAAIFRQVAEPIANISADIERTASAKVRREVSAEYERKLTALSEKHRRVLQRIHEFERLTGLRLSGAIAPNYESRTDDMAAVRLLGHAVAFVTSGGAASVLSGCESRMQSIIDAATELQRLTNDLGRVSNWGAEFEKFVASQSEPTEPPSHVEEKK